MRVVGFILDPAVIRKSLETGCAPTPPPTG
jgi:hypothetical protein